MKPCGVCIEAFGKPACSSLKGCLLGDVPGLSPEEALSIHLVPVDLVDTEMEKISIKVASIQV